MDTDTHHHQVPTLTLLPSTTTTVVTTTTTQTTVYPPIPLPLPPAPSTLYPNLSLSPSTRSPGASPPSYPLLHAPLPTQTQAYFLPGVRAKYHSGEPSVPEAELRPGLDRGESWVRLRREEEADGDVLLQNGSVRDALERSITAGGVPTPGSCGSTNGSAGKGRKRMLSNNTEHVGAANSLPSSLVFSSAPAQSNSQADVRMSEGPPSPPPPSPPRKKARALHLQTHGSTSGPGLHPLPSPSNSPPPSISEPAQAESSTVTTTYSNSPPELPILPLQTLMSLPMLLTQYSQLPAALQTHVLLSLLKLSPLSVLRATDGFVTPALSRDFLSLLPTELSLQILQCLDLRSLLRCCRVCRNWRDLIDGEAPLWRSILKHYKLWFESPSRASLPPSMRLSAHLRPPANYLPTLRPPNPYKTLLRYRLRLQQALTQCPSQMTIPLLTQTVVTCLQISATRIVSASDDHTIHVHSPIDGALLQSLQGHSGGVWALQFVHNTLVSGSTDRTVRVWDLRTGTNTHVFAGHTSTVRCLQIVEKGDNGTWPRRRMIITGSRDNSLRLWYLPREGDAEYKSPGTGEGDTDRDEPQRNPYHVRLFAGHTSAVRALAARGKTLVSGSYDCTVRVWDMSTGECRFVLSGHAQKVYSVALDPIRERCASGSMDGTVRIWCLETGQCLHALTGHTSLVGLLSIRPNQLISAAADSTLRVWSPTSGDLLHTLTGHPAAITCFLHDEFRVLSGSEGSLKMWDADKGEWRRDLLTEVGGVWQVAGWGRRVVSASNRGDETYLDVFEWGGETDADGLLIDDDALYDDASEVSEDSDTADDEEAEHEASYEGEDDGQASRSVKAGQSPYPPAEHVRRVIRQQDEDEIMSQSYGDAEDELDVEEDIDIRHEPVRHLKAPAHISTRAMEPGSEHAADEARDMDPWELSTPTPAPRARSFLGFTGQSLRLPSASSSIAGSSRGSRGNRRWGDDTET